jgi:hypothetical protein
MNEQEKNSLIEHLKKDVAVITFNKVNGDQRVMTCTLAEHVLPQATKDDPLTQKKVREISPEVCAVWDVNANGWRSFRWDKVVSVKLNEDIDQGN